MLSLAVAVLYFVCFALLLGFALFIVTLPQMRKRVVPEEAHLLRQQRLAFLCLLFSLLVWQTTLFVEARTSLPWLQLWLARANFAAIAVAVHVLLRFVSLVAHPTSDTGNTVPARWLRCLRLETALMVALTYLTPLVVESETVVEGMPLTSFGSLFPLYLLHVLGYLALTLTQAVQARHRTTDGAIRGQLTLIGVGIVATAGIALVTNALLPFWLGDFRFCDLGTLSTLLFLIATAYAIFVHGLFDLRLVLIKAIVGGLLLTFVLGGYSSGVFLITQYLSGGGSTDNSGDSSSGNGNVAQFVVLLLAFSFDPLRRFLENKADDLLFGKKSKTEPKRRGSRGRCRRRQ